MLHIQKQRIKLPGISTKMNNEIERKFFVKEMPDLSGITPLHYERYFLERGKDTEIRISKINDSYKYEKKTRVSKLERTREKKDITKEEFEKLKQGATEAIIRDRYDISTDPDISIQIYHGRFEGLVRAEVEFKNEEEALNYFPPAWMREEMTDLPIARDSKLIDLTDEEFRHLTR
jgi:adenylate cyclase